MGLSFLMLSKFEKDLFSSADKTPWVLATVRY
jgi:hypothetical protein